LRACHRSISSMKHTSIHIHLLATGVHKGLSGFWWMLKIIVPISLLTTLLDYSTWIQHIEFLLEPIMGVMHLPVIATIPLIAGILTGVYGGIAAMTVLPLNQAHMTLIAIFLLISHNLIQEGIIQAKSGINPILVTSFRLLASVCAVCIAMQFLDTGAVLTSSQTVISARSPSLLETLTEWAGATIKISLSILLIITCIMILLEEMRHFDLVTKLVNLFNPFLKLLGLQKSVGILWMTAVVFGISYGGAVIIQEAKESSIKKSDLTKLHLSIGVNHSMIDDPALFLSLGLSPFWLWVPRILAAILFVQLFNMLHRIARALRLINPKITGSIE
jgi:Fe2+ transport system protein B